MSKKIYKAQREIDPDFNLVLTEVYNGIELETSENLKLGVSMRDSGYDIVLLDKDNDELAYLYIDSTKINIINNNLGKKSKEINGNKTIS